MLGLIYQFLDVELEKSSKVYEDGTFFEKLGPRENLIYLWIYCNES
jgi:hypothetical protein